MNKFSISIFLLSLTSPAFASEEWRGLTLVPEHRCSPYDKKSQYPYPASVEYRIVESLGGHVYGPYTGRYFESIRQTDIEHIVAASEGHDSGLCGASAETRAAFAVDPLNLTLAAPKVNRCGRTGKCGLDPAEWLPEQNQCWFVNRVIEIKTKYSLTVDRAEANTIDSVLAGCESTSMILYPMTNANFISGHSEDGTAQEAPHLKANNSGHPLDRYDSNGNGRITCAEAREHGIAPVSSQHPAYTYMSDRNNDGVVCE